MDIEEGEIIISDVSSDDSIIEQPQPWNKGVIPVDFDSLRYHSASKSTLYNSSTRPTSGNSKNQHDCNDNSFCRKTFSWQDCLAKDSDRRRRPRSKDVSLVAASRTHNNEKIHARQRYSEDSNHSHTHSNQKSKKKKRKGRSDTSHSSRHKPEKTLRQLISHYENRSVFINEVIQRSRMTSSATVISENTSLMQKLITSGLAKPPLRPDTQSSEVEIDLLGTESGTKIKNEQAPVVNIEPRDESEDSEIEVIIPPKKIPLVVTLDSDGEEEDKLGNSSSNQDQTSKTPNHENNQILSNVSSTLTEERTNQIPDHGKTSNENDPSEENLHNKTYDVNDSSNSVDSYSLSEVCEVLTYSPSSPSSCNSNDVDLTKEPSSQTPVTNVISNSQDSQSGESSYKDLPGDNNEEISSEIWLDVNDQPTPERQDKISLFTSFQEYVNTERTKKTNFEKEHSIFDVVENFIISSSSSTEDSSTQKQTMNKDEELQTHYRNNTCENKSVEGPPNELMQHEEDLSLLPGNLETVGNDQTLKTNCPFLTGNIVKCKSNNECCISGCTCNSDGSNEKPIVANQVLCDDEKTSQTSLNFDKTQDDCTTSSKPQLHIEMSASKPKNDNSKESASFVCNQAVFKANFINPEINTHYEHDNQESSKESEKDDANKIMSLRREEEEENVSQLRMIALLTKGKTLLKETKSDEHIGKSQAKLSANLKDTNIEKSITSEASIGADEDDDVLQLRVAALKSAVLKKYGERKKRGLHIKKQKLASSNDILTSPECNLASEQENSCPVSPAKSPMSFQGEEDMELANSDFGEDVIEEMSTSSAVEESKKSQAVSWEPCENDPSARTFVYLSNTNVHPKNTNLSVPPQPLPPGVDIDCSELTSQAIFTSVLPLPPPPPPPPNPPHPLGFTPLLPPPPPPPFPTLNFESSPKNNLNSECIINNSDNIYPQGEFCNSSSYTLSDSSYEEGVRNAETTCNDQLIGDTSKKQDTAKGQVRSNLITVPVTNNALKPTLMKNQLIKKKRKRNRPGKVPIDLESSLLCITKLPKKSSISLTQKIDQSDTSSRKKDNREISSLNCECITPTNVLLCNTAQHGGSWKDTNTNEIWNKQELCISGKNPADYNLFEQTSLLEDEIDLSEMIVLDEVGMSPEHRSKNEGNLDYSSPQEEEDDVNTLRIRALTTLSPKPVNKNPTSNLSCPQPKIQTKSIHKDWSNYDSSENEHNMSRREETRLKVKSREVHSHRQVIGLDASKYRLTRTVSNEKWRNVVHGRESLKVVVPTNSPPLTVPPELPMPVVNRLVINVEKESDSEEECEWTRKIRIQDTNTSLPPGPIVDHELERSIDELLMRARNSVTNSSPKQNTGARSSVAKVEGGKISENDLSLHDTPLKLLPKEKQEEYKRLKAILERKERERQQMRKMASNKSLEKSKPLLQHVLINENKKQNQEDLHWSSENSSSCTTQEAATSNWQKNVRSEPNGEKSKEKTTRRVIFGESRNLNVTSPEQRGPSLTQQFKVPVIAKSLQAEAEKTFDNSESNLKNNQFLETIQPKFIDKTSKLTSSLISTRNIKNKRGNFDDMEQQKPLMLNTNVAVKELEDKPEYSLLNQSETLPVNAARQSVISQTNYKDSLALDRPELLSVEARHSLCEGKQEHLLHTAEKQNDEAIEGSTKNTCKEPSEDKNNSFGHSKIHSTHTDDICCSMNEGNNNKPLDNHRLQKEVSSVSHSSEVEKQNQQIQRKRIQNSSKNISLGSFDRRTEPLNESYLKHQESLQNFCPKDDEVLDFKQSESELLNERFGLLDDLSEMAESLDDLDNQQGRLLQAAMRISDLRKALRAAEESLHNQIAVTQSLNHKLYDSHSAVATRYTNIEYLEKSLQHASYEIPTTAQKLMFKKVEQVREKIDKVKMKRSVINRLVNNPDTPKEKLTKLHDTLLVRKSKSSDLHNKGVPNILWLRDPNSSRLEALPMGDPAASPGSRTTSETQTLLSCTDGSDRVMDLLQPSSEDHPKCVQTIDMTNNPSGLAFSENEITCLLNRDASMSRSELEACHTSPDPTKSGVESSDKSRLSIEDITSTLKSSSPQAEEKDVNTDDVSSEKDLNEPCTSKRPFTQLEDNSEYAIAKKPHLEENEIKSSETKLIVPDSNINTGTCERIAQRNPEKPDGPRILGISKTKSKLSYKSILQYKTPSSRVDDSPSGQAILCPYDLTGRCQDKQCKFQHFH